MSNFVKLTDSIIVNKDHINFIRIENNPYVKDMCDIYLYMRNGKNDHINWKMDCKEAIELLAKYNAKLNNN